MRNKSEDYYFFRLSMHFKHHGLYTFDNLNELKLKDELQTIRINGCSELVYKTVMLLEYCKDKNEPYIVNNGISSLGILYCLKLLPFDPLENECKKEPFFGCGISDPKKQNNSSILVRTTFINELINYLKTINEDYDLYYHSAIFDEEIEDGLLHFLPKGYNFEKHGASYVKRDDKKQINKGINRTVNDGLIFNIQSFSALDEINLDKLSFFPKGMSLISEDIKRGDLSYFKRFLNKHELVIPNKAFNSLYNLIAFFSLNMNGFKQEGEKHPIQDLDYLFLYLIRHYHFNYYKVCRIIEQAKDDLKISLPLLKVIGQGKTLKALSNITALSIRGVSLQLAYYFILFRVKDLG